MHENHSYVNLLYMLGGGWICYWPVACDISQKESFLSYNDTNVHVILYFSHDRNVPFYVGRLNNIKIMTSCGQT